MLSRFFKDERLSIFTDMLLIFSTFYFVFGYLEINTVHNLCCGFMFLYSVRKLIQHNQNNSENISHLLQLWVFFYFTHYMFLFLSTVPFVNYFSGIIYWYMMLTAFYEMQHWFSENEKIDISYNREAGIRFTKLTPYLDRTCNIVCRVYIANRHTLDRIFKNVVLVMIVKIFHLFNLSYTKAKSYYEIILNFKRSRVSQSEHTPEHSPAPVSVTEPVPDAVPVVEPVVEPEAEQLVEPVVESVAEPVVEPVAEPVAEPVVESDDVSTIESVDEPVADESENDTDKKNN